MAMHALFVSIHPPNGLSKGVGVVKKTFNALSQHFPSYPQEVLNLTSRMFTFNRLRLMNEIEANKSGKGKKGDKTIRGKNATTRLAHSN